jgi:hypothetical protein
MVYIDVPVDDMRPESLRAALAGQSPDFPPSTALALIADLEQPGIDKRSLLTDIIGDTSVDSSVRAAALRVLARVQPHDAVRDLLSALEAPDDRMAAAAATGLGMIGGPDQLSQLQLAYDKASDETLRRKAAFAQFLIVHRYGITDRDAPSPSFQMQKGPSPVGGHSFNTSRPGPRRRAEALEGIKRELPTLDTTKHDVYEMQCGPRLLEVAASTEVLGDAATMTRKPALAAVVAFQNLEHERFFPGLLVFTRPNGQNGINLLVTRPGGDPAYAGTGTVSGDTATLQLKAVSAPGIVPIEATIRLTGKTLEISGSSGRTGRPATLPQRAKHLDTE